jgi:hypothetical protein
MTLKFLNKGLAKKYQDMAKKLPEVKDRVLHDVAEEAKQDFEKTVETWKDKPKFEIDERPRSIAVITDDEIFGFVDRGTKPHTIRAKNQNALAFQGGYQAKTTPRVIASRPGGRSGPTVFAVEVHHPGTEAREFTKTIYNKWQREFTNRMREALKQGIESIGL